MNTWEKRKILNLPLTVYASLEVADISSAVFGVNVIHRNKHAKVNTFEALKEICGKNATVFLHHHTLDFKLACYYFHVCLHAVVIMSSGTGSTIQPLIYTTVDQLATSLLNSLFWPNNTMLDSNPSGPCVSSLAWILGMLSFLFIPLTSSAIQLEQDPWALQCFK